MAANDRSDRAASKDAPCPKKPLTPAAERALAEAAERRAAAEQQKRAAAEQQKQGGAGQPKETEGRGGLDPTRYGDWEVKGVASDF
jgi:hypothetical protein